MAPYLLHLSEHGFLHPFDVMLGQSLQQEGGLLGAFVAKAFRMGHMAVRRTGGRLLPSVQEVFTDDNSIALDNEMAQRIHQAIFQEIDQQKTGHLIVEEDWISLPKARAIETDLAKQIVRLSTAAPSTPACQAAPDATLNEEQRAAIDGALRHTLCSITGGPGTGKTYTAGRLLQALASSYPALRIALAAPTGRAVQTLEASIRSVLGDAPSIAIDARTVHSLVLGPSSFLPYHIVVIDESSMIDSQMMLSLTQRLHDGTRVVFLGDPGQLPSIEPGQPFFDLLAVSGLHQIGHYTLNTSRRTSSADLLTFASIIRQGDREGARHWLSEPTEGVRFINCASADDWTKAYAAIDEMAVQPWKERMSLLEAQELQRKTIVLTPTRKGIGSDEINHRAQGAAGPFCPVINLQNSYHLGVMNGDLGILERQHNMDYIHFHHSTIPAILCPKFERAFAVTVHKSQGSEFDRVVLLLPPRAVIDRKLLYTAVTRAKKQVVIMGSQEDVLNAVGQCHERISTLPMRLRSLNGG